MSGTIEPALLAAFKGKIMAAAAVHPWASIALAASIPAVGAIYGYGTLSSRVDIMEQRAAEDRAAMIAAVSQLGDIKSDLKLIRNNQEWYNRTIGANVNAEEKTR